MGGFFYFFPQESWYLFPLLFKSFLFNNFSFQHSNCIPERRRFNNTGSWSVAALISMFIYLLFPPVFCLTNVPVYTTNDLGGSLSDFERLHFSFVVFDSIVDSLGNILILFFPLWCRPGLVDGIRPLHTFRTTINSSRYLALHPVDVSMDDCTRESIDQLVFVSS